MKRCILVLVLGLLYSTPIRAQDAKCEEPAYEVPAAASCCDECDTGCQKCCPFTSWLKSLHRCPIEGQEPFANCGCNGSYKYPVPPLYTYHWPGMYSRQLMTEYYSPWRFPPIRPYSDAGPVAKASVIQQVSHTPQTRQFVPISERLRQRQK